MPPRKSRRNRRQPAPQAAPTSPDTKYPFHRVEGLAGLPAELLDMIACHADPASAAFFALTCKALLKILGRGRLQLRGIDRAIVLSELSKKTDGKQYCLVCEKIHTENSEYESSWYKNWRHQCDGAADPWWESSFLPLFYSYRGPGSDASNPNTGLAPGFTLHWGHIHFIMQKWRLGFDVSVELARLTWRDVEIPDPLDPYGWFPRVSMDWTREPAEQWRRQNSNFDILPRVVGGRFLVRKTERVPAKFASDGKSATTLTYKICHHMQWDSVQVTPSGDWEGGIVALGRGLRHCHVCDAEWFIEPAPEEPSKRIEVTAWLTFGHGQRPDEHFRHHHGDEWDTRRTDESPLGSTFGPFEGVGRGVELSAKAAACRALTEREAREGGRPTPYWGSP